VRVNLSSSLIALFAGIQSWTASTKRIPITGLLKIIYTFNLPGAVSLGGAYDRGGASPVTTGN